MPAWRRWANAAVIPHAATQLLSRAPLYSGDGPPRACCRGISANTPFRSRRLSVRHQNRARDPMRAGRGVFRRRPQGQGAFNGTFFPDAQAVRDFMQAECGWKDTDIVALASARPLEDCDCKARFGEWIVWQPCAGCGAKLACAPDAVADYHCDDCDYDTDESIGRTRGRCRYARQPTSGRYKTVVAVKSTTIREGFANELAASTGRARLSRSARRIVY